MSALGFYPTRAGVSSLELPAACVVSVTGGRAWTIAAHEALQGRPKREWMGEDPQPLRVELDLHAERGIDPSAVRVALESFGGAGEVLEVSGTSGRVYGLCLIESVSASELAEEIVDSSPAGLRLTVALVDAGDDDIAFFSAPTPIGLAGGVVGPTTDQPASDGPYADASAVSPQEIARR